MNILKYISFFGLAVIAASAAAQQSDISVTPIPDWVEESNLLPVPDNAAGLVFMRKQDVFARLDEKGQRSFFAQRARLLHPQALELGNITISWNPASGDAAIHRLTVHRGSETIDVLKQAKFEILRREDQLEQAMLDGILTATLRVPDLRVGDELDIAYSVPGHDPTLVEQSFGALFLSPATPQGRFTLGLQWTDGQEPNIKVSDDFSKTLVRSPRMIRHTLDNPEAVSVPDDAPLRYKVLRNIQFSDFGSWSELSRRFHSIFVAASSLSSNSAVKIEAERIAKMHSDQRSRILAALLLVQRDVRYVYVGLNGGNFTSVSADQTWERRYGDCKGKTALLLALLKELEINAEAVLVNNSLLDDGMESRLPSPGQFDHVLVRASIEGEQLWLDGTMPSVVGASGQPILPYKAVLPLSEAGSELELIKPTAPTIPDEMGIYEIDARAGFEMPAARKVSFIKRGIAGVREYIQLSPLAPNQLEQTIRDAWRRDPSWATIEKAEYRYDTVTKASILTVSGTGKVDWEKETDGGYSLFLPGGGFSPPSEKFRTEAESELTFYLQPTYSCHTATLRLPTDTKMENWGYNSTFDQMYFGRRYYRMMELRSDKTIRMVRGSRVEQAEIDWATAQNDNDRLDDFDNSKAYVMYSPDDILLPFQLFTPVPATFEIDWKREHQHCLPANIKRTGMPKSN